MQKHNSSKTCFQHKKKEYMLFGSVVAVVFQSTFRAEMHQNDVFFYF
jgi:hypothetical protein